MASLLALVLASVRRRLRSPAALPFAVLLAGAVAAAVLAPRAGAGAAAVALETALVVLGTGAALVAASTAGPLAEDRASGVLAWLASTRAPRPFLRAAPAVAGAGVTVLAAVGAAGLAALLLGVGGLTVPIRTGAPLDVEIGAGGPAHDPAARVRSTIRGIPAAPDRLVEVELRPRYRDAEAAGVGSVTLEVVAGGAPPTRREAVAVRGRSDLLLPGGADLVVRSLDPRVDVTVVAARTAGAPASFPLHVLLAGLLAGLALACLAPTAGLLARFVSPGTGVGASLAVGAVGVLRTPLLELARDAEAAAGGAGVAAGGVLRAVAAVAPDLSVVGRAAEVVRGHALGLEDFAALAAPGLHAAGALVLLALLPSRRFEA